MDPCTGESPEQDGSRKERQHRSSNTWRPVAEPPGDPLPLAPAPLPEIEIFPFVTNRIRTPTAAKAETNGIGLLASHSRTGGKAIESMAMAFSQKVFESQNALFVVVVLLDMHASNHASGKPHPHCHPLAPTHTYFAPKEGLHPAAQQPKSSLKTENFPLEHLGSHLPLLVFPNR